VLLLTFWLTSFTAMAAEQIELLDLQHRNAAEMMQLMQPLLKKNESVTGTGYQLILKADESRLETLKELARSLDSRVKQLRYSVRIGADQAGSRDDIGARGGITINRDDVDIQGKAHVLSTERRGSQSESYTVTGMEGTPVYIAEGLRFPVTSTSTQIVNGRVIVTPDTQYESATSGFYALAWTRGDEVTVDIAPQREALLSERYGSVSHQSVQTRVRGALGEWLLIGGQGRINSRDQEELARHLTTRDRDENQVWLKIDVID
jgi:hypothetical protein